MIADKGCAERGCPCYDSRDGPGVEMTERKEWVGLTVEEIKNTYFTTRADFVDYARAIEAKLKEKNT